MSVAQIQEQIQNLSFEERVELAHWLKESTTLDNIDPEVEAESLRIANQRLADLESGRVKGLSEEEFWERVENDRYGEAEDAELELARKRCAELEAGTKRLLSEEEFWAGLQAFKSKLQADG